mmetsp:Transcript_100289/g.239110  ORF Transcript_100289/g.239110 Transcript_100289/m.239110 type:complete len:240 (-) Transcript_100289:643-1362(-)
MGADVFAGPLAPTLLGFPLQRHSAHAESAAGVPLLEPLPGTARWPAAGALQGEGCQRPHVGITHGPADLRDLGRTAFGLYAAMALPLHLHQDAAEHPHGEAPLPQEVCHCEHFRCLGQVHESTPTCVALSVVDLYCPGVLRPAMVGLQLFDGRLLLPELVIADSAHGRCGPGKAAVHDLSGCCHHHFRLRCHRNAQLPAGLWQLLRPEHHGLRGEHSLHGHACGHRGAERHDGSSAARG